MTILVGTDFSKNAFHVADVAADLARRRGEDLLLVHVVDGPLIPEIAERDEARLADEVRRLTVHGCRIRTTLERDGSFGVRLAEVAERERATLLVVGAQGAGLRSPLGTVATIALRHTSEPVLVVREAQRLWAPRSGAARLRVLVPFAVASDSGLVDALQLVASAGDFDADFAHYRSIPEPLRRSVAESPTDEAGLCAHFTELPRGLHVASVVERSAFGRLDSHVADLAREMHADLIVCGSHHRHGAERLREGSTAEGIVVRAPVSVLVARAAQRVPRAIADGNALRT